MDVLSVEIRHPVVFGEVARLSCARGASRVAFGVEFGKGLSPIPVCL